MRKLFLLIGLFSLSISVGAQQQVLSEIEAKIRNTNFMAETVFLHTDKSLYVAGETIWLKAYVLNRYTQQLQDVSATIYVELLNNENIPAWQARIKASEGMGTGSFNISYQFASGYYRLRAYTYWMESAPESFFEQQLTIINTLRPLDTLAFQSAISAFSVVPENGRLTSGIQNNVIFRYGNRNNFYGYLKNESGDTVLKFAPDYAGAGSFSFVPEAGLKYFAIIANDQEKGIEKELSVTAGQGYYISTKESGDNLLVETQTNHSGNETLYLIIHKGSQISYSGIIAPDRKTATITIPKTTLPYGVSDIRLYNSLKEEKYHKWIYRAPAKS
ncbi:MAG TPA: MG2 domain-containing protein, partial [Ginsengibacter sp.]|nr:MG2 domain-containing protein [Ginsengibacter sp.]